VFFYWAVQVLLDLILQSTLPKTEIINDDADNFARGKQDDYFTELVSKHNIKVVEGDYTNPKLLINWIKNTIRCICWHRWWVWIMPIQFRMKLSESIRH
jgi:hypothetical protein